MLSNRKIRADDLTQSDLFQDVPVDIIERVLAQTLPRRLANDELLLTPEIANDHVYLLLAGTLTVHFGSLDSPVIRDLKPGVCVGEVSIIDEGHPSAYVVASEPSLVLPIHRDLILQLIDDANPFARNMLRIMARWIRANTRWILNDRQYIWELYDNVNYDVLTRLYNRRWLENALPRLLEQAAKTGQPLTLLMLDIDHFKQINDTHGHPAGDQALIAMGHVLSTVIGPDDFAIRYGGEEFIVLLPDTDLAEGRNVAERIREATMLANNKNGSQEIPDLTASIGVAVSGDECASAASLIAEADIQLYRAKKLGRNRVCWAGDQTVA